MWTQRLHRPGDEFWGLTYREIAACIKAYNQDEEQHRLLFGLVAATLINVNRSKDSDRVWHPGDFFEHGGGSVGNPSLEAPEPRYQTLDEMRTAFRKWHAVDGTN